ncbi:hypothetical protein H9K76_06370 [Diaphorobacter ruginosibacter]|uniref:Lipoprotein n=1 Tax=Diaphorobacter ruginosibacter TaxID=1715720 RepID=A0A7G9RS86_9BURK|nr:hypothetical protein [Diaphorobacter ruginosibacter]MDR2335177.1 hypothetical protein [Burkholderiaceae bacterium]QNN58461.1 hypothetical protein H9K76_06370 [Diaphorobacter ruginosibacter]
MKTLTMLGVLAVAAMLSACEPKTTPSPKAVGPEGTTQPAPGSANPNSGMPGPGNGGTGETRP